MKVRRIIIFPDKIASQRQQNTKCSRLFLTLTTMSAPAAAEGTPPAQRPRPTRLPPGARPQYEVTRRSKAEALKTRDLGESVLREATPPPPRVPAQLGDPKLEYCDEDVDDLEVGPAASSSAKLRCFPTLQLLLLPPPLPLLLVVVVAPTLQLLLLLLLLLLALKLIPIVADMFSPDEVEVW